MTAGLLYDTSTVIGTGGRARARRDQVIAMTPKVLEDTGDRLVVERWFSAEVSVWVRVGLPKEQMYELLPADS